MDVVGVMAAYLPMVRVCVLHSLERHTRTTSKYVAITPSASISTDTIEPLLLF